MNLGFGMDGMENQILDVARKVRAAFRDVTYVEIGVGAGATLAGIAQTLADPGNGGQANGKRGQWRAVGVELPNGYSFSHGATEQAALGKGIKIDFVTPQNGNIERPPFDQITVYFRDSQSFLTENWNAPIHFALIDGCHGRPCATADFLAIEAFMVRGGIAMFHDFDKAQVGMEQPHCPGGCDVYGACVDLGLVGNKRKGWKSLGVFTANKAAGGWDMGVFKKEK